MVSAIPKSLLSGELQNSIFAYAGFGQMPMVRQQSHGPGLAKGENSLLSCVGKRNGGPLKDLVPC